jgi:putative membrane protein
MIIDGRTNLFSLLKGNYRSIVGVIVVIILAELATVYEIINLQRAVFEAAALGLLATALSIFLVFRVNEAYARWWEARILWGGLVNSSRSFARQAITLIGTKPDQREASRALQQEFVYRQIAYVNALRMSLRCEEDWQSLSSFLQQGELDLLKTTANKPVQLLQTQGKRLEDVREAGLLDGFGHRMLDGTLSEICDHQGGCERIKNTVFPDRVAYFTRAVAWLLVILIPICVVAATEEITVIELFVIPIMVLVFVFTVQLGSELKNPFENKPNDTPMTAICRTIEIDLRQQLGEDVVPVPVQPVDGILL